jgi:aminoglycoside 2'-N-acetyltransferase I
MAQARLVTTDELTASELAELRAMLVDAFKGRFDEHDWQHALGGHHALVEEDGAVVSHAAVVPRLLVAGERRVRTGYAEAVATAPDHRGRGHAAAVMDAVNRIVGIGYELGALSTGLQGFYERFGWQRWLGPTYAEGPRGRRRTRWEDRSIRVLLTARTADLDVTAALACDWREGDLW